jgi:hypothetical protein
VNNIFAPKKGNLTSRSRRLATLAFFEGSLLAELCFNEVTLPTGKRLSSWALCSPAARQAAAYRAVAVGGRSR